MTFRISDFFKLPLITFFRLKSILAIVGALCTCHFFYLPESAASEKKNGAIQLAAFDYPPFYITDSTGIHGIGVDLANELFQRIKMDVHIILYPLKRALIYMGDGRVDATMILISTQERGKYLVYTNPVVSANGYVWSNADRKDGPVDFERLEDLRPYKIGITIGYSYGEVMDTFLKSANTDSAPKEYFTFKKLLARRVDIVPATDMIARSMIKNHPEFKDKFSPSKHAFLNSDYHMGISKRSGLVQILPLINRTIGEMKADGFIDATLKKYTE